MRAADPAAAARAFVAAGRRARRIPANVARRPVREDLRRRPTPAVPSPRSRAGADAIGLNLVPGTPRALDLDEAAALARLVRTAVAGRIDGRWSSRSPSTRPPAQLDAIVAAVRPRRRPAQRDGAASASVRRVGRPVWKVLHLPAAAPADVATAAGGRSSPRPGLPRGRRRAPPARHRRRPASRRHRDARVGSTWPRPSPGRCR